VGFEYNGGNNCRSKLKLTRRKKEEESSSEDRKEITK
jgi:hypothetical protein